MEERAKIIVRYQCNGCNQIFEDVNDLTKIAIKQIRGSMIGQGTLQFTERWALSCKDCLAAPKGDQPPQKNPVGFRQLQND